MNNIKTTTILNCPKCNAKQITKDFSVTHQTTKIIVKDGKEVTRTLEEWDKATFSQQINAVL